MGGAVRNSRAGRRPGARWQTNPVSFSLLDKGAKPVYYIAMRYSVSVGDMVTPLSPSSGGRVGPGEKRG